MYMIMIKNENKYWPGFRMGKGVFVTFTMVFFISVLWVTWLLTVRQVTTSNLWLPVAISKSVWSGGSCKLCQHKVDVLNSQETVA